MADVQLVMCSLDTTARSRSAPAHALTGSGTASATTRADDGEEGAGPPAQRGAQAPQIRRQSPEPDDGERVQDDISTGDQASHGAVSVHFGFALPDAATPAIVPRSRGRTIHRLRCCPE